MHVLKNVPLGPLTTMRVGGSANYFCHVRSVSELREALEFALAREIPFFILGEGSNIIVSDDGFRGLVIKMGIEGKTFESVGRGAARAVVAAGENWDEFVSESVSRGLFGLENLSGIPGSVGAAPIQNIGAYGAEVGKSIEAVETIDSATLKPHAFTAEECAFGYRDSFFKTKTGKRFVVTAIIFCLSQEGEPNVSYRDLEEYFRARGDEPSPGNVREAVLAIRAGKLPDLSALANSGSFFKNPVVGMEELKQLKKIFPNIPAIPVAEDGGKIKIPAAWLIENSGDFKGIKFGTAGVYEKHALSIVNFGGASAKNILTLAKKIQSAVRKKTGVKLELEVRTVGCWE